MRAVLPASVAEPYPALACVQFETVADAEDAIRGRDGYEFDGERLRVELAHSGAPGALRSRDGAEGRGGRGDGRDRWGRCCRCQGLDSAYKIVAEWFHVLTVHQSAIEAEGISLPVP